MPDKNGLPELVLPCVITANGVVNPIQLNSKGQIDLATLKGLVKGFIEIVRPMHYPTHVKHAHAEYAPNDGTIVMIVNDEGTLQGLPLNIIASHAYGTPEHGHPIVGDVVFCKQKHID